MKTKLLISITLLNLVLFTSCENVPEMILSPYSVTLYYEDEKSISVTGNTSTVYWETEDDFVATVEDGVITAGHVGTTVLSAVTENQHAICQINVIPMYYTYEEPIINWGCSKQSIISKKGTPDSTSSSGIAYVQNENKGIVEMYLFENEQLKYSYVMLSLNSYNTDVSYFLLERYEPITYTNGVFGFINAMSLDNADLVVTLSVDDYVLVGYGEYSNDNSANSPARIAPRQDKYMQNIDALVQQLVKK